MTAPPRGDDAARRPNRLRSVALVVCAARAKSLLARHDAIYGFAGEFGFAIGGAVRPHHILAFHLWDVAISNATVTFNGSSPRTTSNFSIFCMGPQYTFYGAKDLYLSVTPALSWLNGESGGSSSTSDLGFGLQLAFGKEWKVSEKWGLGAVGQLTFAVNDDSTPNPPTFTTFAFTVAFSATYN